MPKRLLFLDELSAHNHLDVVAKCAILEAVDCTKVRTFDRESHVDTEACVTPGIFTFACDASCRGDCFGLSKEGQLPYDVHFFTCLGDFFTFEGDVFEHFCVEEVWTTQVLVAFSLVCEDARCVDLHTDGSATKTFFAFLGFDNSRELAKASVEESRTKVLHAKQDVGVACVDFPCGC